MKAGWLLFSSHLVRGGPRDENKEEGMVAPPRPPLLFKNTTLRKQYPALYNISHHKSDTIAIVLETSPPNVTFRRDFLDPRLAVWNSVLGRPAMTCYHKVLMHFVGIKMRTENSR